MKKFTFIIAAMLITTLAFAQTTKTYSGTFVSKDGTTIVHPVELREANQSKANYITEAFDIDPLVWEQQNLHATSNWFAGNPEDNPFSNVDATNVYSALKAYINQNCNEIIYSPVFDATGSTNLKLSFYVGYSGPWMIGGDEAGSLGADVRAVISTDGGANWIQLWSYADTHNGNESWAWELVEIDLQTTYGGNSNLIVGFQYFGNDGDLAAIDGVLVEDYVAPTDPDLSVMASAQQAMTPIAHATYALGATVTNDGSDLVAAETLNISVAPGTYTDAMTITLPFAAGEDSTFTSTNYFVADAVGTYTATFAATLAADPTPENNTATVEFDVTALTFGTDNGTILGGGGSNTAALTFGNIYFLMSEDVINSFTIGWSEIAADQDFTVSIYSINPTTFALTEVYTSGTLTKTVAMSETYADFDIEDQTLAAGIYLFAVNQLDATNIAVGYDGVASGMIYIWDGTQLGQTGALGNVAIRVNVAESSNVESNIAAAISVYPNPANNVITVANAENENIVVINMLGEVVANISNATSNQTIDISELSNGTYFVRVNSEVFKINVVK